MRKFIMIMFSFMVITGLLACDADDVHGSGSLQQPEEADNDKEDDEPEENIKVKITTGSAIFTATLENNETATAFKKLLPVTIVMFELNNNEKYCELPKNLPVSSSNPETIENGDLMLYGTQTLVLFYKSFSTSYRYTRLGKINDVTGLVSALGSGNVTVTIESE